jgi:hypothetical protein
LRRDRSSSLPSRSRTRAGRRVARETVDRSPGPTPDHRRGARDVVFFERRDQKLCGNGSGDSGPRAPVDSPDLTSLLPGLLENELVSLRLWTREARKYRASRAQLRKLLYFGAKFK